MPPESSLTPPLQGDEAELFRRYDQPLHWVVSMNVTGDKALVDDACQIAWTQLLRRQPDRDRLFGWLCKVAIRESWRLYREARVTTPFAVINESRELADHGMDDQLQARAVLHASRHLKRRQRETVLLRIHGFSYDEIAQLRGVTFTNVNRHLTEGRRELRFVLQAH